MLRRNLTEVQGVAAGLIAGIEAAVRDALVRAWVGVGAADADAVAAPELRAAVGHALAFGPWRSLVREEGLGDEQAVVLMLALVRCTASAPRSGGDRRPHVLWISPSAAR